MATDRLLVPTPNDPTIRLYERIAALETRTAVLERRRQFDVTPFTVVSGSGPSNFETHGGYIAILCGAILTTNAATTAVCTVSVNGNAWQALAATAGGAWSVGTGVTCQYIATNWIVQGGTNSITVAAGANVTQAVVQGIVMEWALPSP